MLDFYELLNLQSQRSQAQIPAQEVKTAYKRALLRYHPDKNNVALQTCADIDLSSQVTVDDIALAYKILSDPKLRAEYDSQLQNVKADSIKSKEPALRTGLETVDLDDLDYDSERNVWRRQCRCGDITGFLLTETDLEMNVEDGEIIVGCKGCSLWLRVLFSLEDGRDIDPKLLC